MDTERGLACDRIADSLKAFFESNPHGAIAVYLYGSVARGTARDTSDVDVAILYRHDPPRAYESLPFRLEGELEKLVGRTVQVVVLNQCPADLGHRVLRDGKLLLDRDPSFRIQFEVKIRNEFFDLEPILQRYRRFPSRNVR